jgi:ubiquinone/menaquinone biosynthesis C-methylase UbiE
MNLHNVVFREMDMQAIDFPDRHFEIAVSAFSIFFIEDMEKQLTHIAQKVKHGGEIIITTFCDNAFSPLVALFLTVLKGTALNRQLWHGRELALRNNAQNYLMTQGCII